MEMESQKTVHLGPGEGRAVRMPGAQLVTTKVAAEQAGGAYSLFEVEVGPGCSELPHIQHHDDECLYVLDGEFEFLDDDGSTTKVVGPGSVVYVPKGNLHRYRNTSETAGRLLVIHTPGGLRELFLEDTGEQMSSEVASPATGEPPDAERIVRIGVEYGIEIVPLPPH